MKAGNAKRRRGWIRWTRVSLVAGVCVSVVAWALIVVVATESVIFTGPILFALGLFSTIAGYFLRYRGAIFMGASEMGIVLLFTALVNILTWSPGRAFWPFLFMGAVYVLATAPFLFFVLSRAPKVVTPGECSECGYLLIGLSEPRCPECGTTFDPSLLAWLSSSEPLQDLKLAEHRADQP